MALSALSKVQQATETTYGTVVTVGTGKLYPDKLFSLSDKQPYHQAMERRGSFAKTRRSYLTRNQPESNSFEADATFEDLSYFLNMALKVAVITGAGDPYTYTHIPSTVAANVPTSYSIQYGDDTQAYIAAGCLAKSLSISGKENEALKLKCELFAKSIATATFTAALADRTVESILAEKCKMYFDSTGGAIGTGAQAKSDGSSVANAWLIDWEWKIAEHYYPIFHQAGALTATTFGEKMFQPELDITIAFKAAAAAIRVLYAAGTRQLIRINNQGSSANRTLAIDGAYIVIDDPIVLDERDGGETIVKLKLMGEYDSTDALFCSVVVKQGNATLP